MKATTKKQKSVVQMSSELKPMTSCQRRQAERCAGTAYADRGMAWCTVCGQEWESDLTPRSRKLIDTATVSNAKKVTCPHCGARLDVDRREKWVGRESYYFTIATVHKGWQVLRTFFCKRVTRRGQEQDVSIEEVFQNWLDGKEWIPFGYTVHCQSYYYDSWNLNSGWQVRRMNRQYEVSGYLCKCQRLLPELHKRGLKSLKEKYGFYVQQIMETLTEPKAEILLKGGQNDLFAYLISGGHYRVENYWQSIRVAMRHHYYIKDPSLWLDYIDDLSHLGRDIRNPRLICPENVRKAHLETQRIRERQRQRQQEERERIRLMAEAEKLTDTCKENLEYVRRMGAKLGVVVQEGDIRLQVLQSLRAFYEEGKELHHCVFTNSYYDREGVIIIGATIDGKRTETIELNSQGAIIQCRGKYNQPSARHSDILRLMEKNKSKFLTA